MAEPNLTAEERTALLKLLRDKIDGDRFRLSPRIRIYKAIIAKFDPAAAPSAAEQLAAAQGLGQQQHRAGQTAAVRSPHLHAASAPALAPTVYARAL